MQIKHRPGRDNGNADALSRLSRVAPSTEKEPIPVLPVTSRAPFKVPGVDEILRRAQEQDPEIRATIDFLRSPTGQEAPPTARQMFLA